MNSNGQWQYIAAAKLHQWEGTEVDWCLVVTTPRQQSVEMSNRNARGHDSVG